MKFYIKRYLPILVVITCMTTFSQEVRSQSTQEEWFDLAGEYLADKKYVLSVEILERLGEEGHIESQSFLGLIFHAGNTIPQDYSRAKKWYEKAVEQEDTESEYGFANLYLSGKGVPKNIKKARELYRKAAEKGHVQSQINLAYLIRDKNQIEAYAWCNLAATNTDARREAKECLRDIEEYVKMTPEQIATAQEMSWKFFQDIPRE